MSTGSCPLLLYPAAESLSGSGFFRNIRRPTKSRTHLPDDLAFFGKSLAIFSKKGFYSHAVCRGFPFGRMYDQAPANFLFDRNPDVTAEKNGTADGLCRAPFYQHHFNDGTTYDRSEGF